MNTYADKTRENNNRSAMTTASQDQCSGDSAFQYLDKRPQVVVQKTLRETANNSPRGSRLKSFHSMADNSPQAEQVAQLKAGMRKLSGMPPSAIIQRTAKGPIKTSGGTWKAEEYRKAKNGDPGISNMSIMNGARIKLDFTPESPTDGEVIGLSQAVKSEQNGVNPFATGREKHPGAYNIDQVTNTSEAKTNPLYASKGHNPEEAPLEARGTHSGLGKHGKRVQAGNSWTVEDAKLEDTPVLWKYVGGIPSNGEYAKESQLFETTALVVKGQQAGTYLGSVKWGWSATPGNFSLHDMSLGSYGTPGKEFQEAREGWNAAPGLQKLPSVALPVLPALISELIATYPNASDAHIEQLGETDYGAFILTGTIPAWGEGPNGPGKPLSPEVGGKLLKSMLSEYPNLQQFHLDSLTNEDMGQFLFHQHVWRWD